jgi:Cupin-like domain
MSGCNAFQTDKVILLRNSDDNSDVVLAWLEQFIRVQTETVLLGGSGDNQMESERWAHIVDALHSTLSVLVDDEVNTNVLVVLQLDYAVPWQLQGKRVRATVHSIVSLLSDGIVGERVRVAIVQRQQRQREDDQLVADDFVVCAHDGRHVLAAESLRLLIERGHNDCLIAHLLSQGVVTLLFRFDEFVADDEDEDNGALRHKLGLGALDSRLVSELDAAATTKCAGADCRQRSLVEIVGMRARSVDVWQWQDDESTPMLDKLIAHGRPVLIRGAIDALGWPALSLWSNFSHVGELLKEGDDNARLDEIEVKVARRGQRLTFYRDRRAAADHVRVDAGDSERAFSMRNVSIDSFVTLMRQSAERLANGDDDGGGAYERFLAEANDAPHERQYYFGKMTRALAHDVQPSDALFWHGRDYNIYSQWLWASTGGLATQLHFDMDHNCFGQIAGRKRFVLLPPTQIDRAHMWPRLHPLWHKSSCDMYAPLDGATRDCAALLRSDALDRARVADVRAGDVLYVPPFWMHHVESLDASLSTSTWSHAINVYERMDALYSQQFTFELFAERRARIAALRLLIDLIVNDLIGHRKTASHMAALVKHRFNRHNWSPTSSVEEAHEEEEEEEEEPLLCSCDLSAPLPVASHVLHDQSMDAGLAASSLRHLLSTTDVTRTLHLLDNWLEELVATTLGARCVIDFMSTCFNHQSYEQRIDSHFWRHR